MSALQVEAVDNHPDPTPVVVKKYANRRLYNTESSSYITLDTLAVMIREGRDFVVYDAKSGDDITRGVLTQIIVEEESKGRAMLPTAFLRQIIGFYGDSLQQLVPGYLEQAMTSFAQQQEQMRTVMQRTMGNFLPPGMQEVGRQNMAMMERAMTLFAPFYRPPLMAAGQMAEPDATAPEPAAPPSEPAGAANGEVDALRHEVDSLRMQLAAARMVAVAPPGAVGKVAKAKRENPAGVEPRADSSEGSAAPNAADQ